MERVWTPEESLAYTRWLATHHYENFHVVSFLLPKRLHQDFYNVYCVLPLGRRSGRRDRRYRRKACACWPGGAANCRRCTRAQRVASGVRGAGRTRSRGIICPIEPFDDLITAFEQDQTVTRYRELRRAVPVLPLFRESGGPAGAGAVRLSRRGAAGAFRRHLHGAATRQFLAGRHCRSGKRPRVSAARSARSATAIRSRRCSRGASIARFRAAMKEAVDVARELFLKGLPLADRSTGGWRSTWTVQPRRPEGSRKDRAPGLRRPRGPAGDLQSGARGIAAGRAHAAGVFAGR